MKKIFFLALVVTLSCGIIEAQSLLKKIGKVVEQTVTNELSKSTSKEASKQSGNNTEPQAKPQQQTQQQRPATPTRSTTTQTAAASTLDKGQNIARQSGLDYIDEWGVNHGGGILINGVLWAPVNCGYHPTKFPYGKLYQWGRKHGQGYGTPFRAKESDVRPDNTPAEIVPAPVTPAEARKYPNRFYARSENSSFNWTRNDMKLWNNFTDDGIIFKNQENDPCPKGWRVADLQDYKSLLKNHSAFTTYHDGGQKGMWFSGANAYSTDVPRIFLPAAGLRYSDGDSAMRDVGGYYWSNRHGGGEGLVWHLTFSKNGADTNPMAYPHDAYAVRCVKDIEGQRMR